MVAPLPYNFHDAALAEVQVGPRADVTLTLTLGLPGRVGDHVAHVRFSHLEDFFEARAFFDNVPPRPSPHVFIDRITYLDYDKTEVSRPKKLVFRLALETYGALTIRCYNVAAWQGNEEPDFIRAHAHCGRNKEEIERSDICGCFYCLAIFPPEDVVTYIHHTPHDQEATTALCPKCLPVDSVIGSASGFPITREFLQQMHQWWF